MALAHMSDPPENIKNNIKMPDKVLRYLLSDEH